MSLIDKSNSRTGRSTVNLLTGVFSQLVILALNFAVRYIFIQKIGYEYLGINSLFTSILTVLSVADLGFGSALGIVLYSSLSKKNEEEIAGLMNFFKKVYLVIGLIVTAVGLAIAPFVKYLVNTDKDIPNLSIYFLLFLLNTVSSYFISYRAILIRADQKNSVVNNTTTIVKIAKAILEIVILLIIPKFLGLIATYFFYLGIMVLSTYAIGLITSIYAKKKYPYAFGNKITISDEKKKDIISTTKDLFVYRLCSAFSSPIDSIIISIFVGTLILGIYSNYLLIFTTLLEFICLVSRNVISSVGNFVVEKPVEEQKKLYYEMQIIYFAIIIFSTINFVSLVTPFISMVFKEGSTLSIWIVFLMGATLITRCISELAIIFRETTRIYKKTKYISLFYTFLHIGLSLLFGYFFGLEGILLGNVIAYFATNFWFEIYALFRWHFKCSPLKVFGMFLYVIVITSGLSVGCYFISEKITADGSFLSFVVAAIVSLSISLISLIALCPLDGFKAVYRRAKTILLSFYKVVLKIHHNRKIQIATFIAYFVSLTVLILVRDLFAININKFIYFALLIVATLLCNKKNAICLLLFTLPISSSLAELYILIYALFYLTVVSYKAHSIKTWLIMFSIPLTLFLMEIILNAIYGTVEINLALRVFTTLGILAIIFYDKTTFTKKHLYSFLLGTLYLFTIMAINWFVPAIYGVAHAKVSWLTLSVLFRECRFGYSTAQWIKNAFVDYPYMSDVVVGENPNNVGLLCTVGLTSVFAIYGTTRNKEKLMLCLMGLLFIAFGLWSLSRTFVIVLLSFIIISIVLTLISKRQDFITALLYFSVIIIVVCIVLISTPDFFKNILQRFSEDSTSTGGGRIELVGDYFKFIFSNWKYALFGVGCSNLLKMSGLEVVPHTNFVQFIGAYGLIAFVGFVIFFILAIKKTKTIVVRSPQLYLIIPLSFTVIFTFTLQLFMPSIILISFIPGILCFSMLNKGISGGKSLVYYATRPSLPLENERIKIAMCSQSFGGGIGSYIANISPCLMKDGFDILYLFNPDTSENEKRKFCSLNANEVSYSNPKPRKTKLGRWLSKYKYYKNVFDTYNPHLIYINGSSYSRLLALMLAAIIHKSSKLIIHCHNAVNSDSKLSFFEKIIRWFVSFDGYVQFACSKEAGEVFFGKKFLSDKEKLNSVINNFIDVEKFKFDANKRQTFRKDLNIDKNDIILGSVGRISEQKNHKFIINLLSSLPTNYKAMIVGNGPLKESLIKLSKDSGMSDRVYFVDATPEVDKCYCSFDYFLLPSFNEGLPFVSVEAQCNGLMNILNDKLPRSTQITDKVIFLPLNINTWAKFIQNSSPIAAEERMLAYQLVENNGFSSKTGALAIINQIKKVIYA